MTPIDDIMVQLASNDTYYDCRNNSTNCTALDGIELETFLVASLGPRHRSNPEATILLVVYVIIFLTGVIGNVCTCLVIVRNKRMHTATNYYLFSLAISDVLTLVLGLPPELYTIVEAYPWRFGQPYCLFKTFLTEMTSSASILTIASFTIERYLAICHSLRAQAMSGLSRAVRNIAIIWLIACFTALPYPIHTRTYYYLQDPVTGLDVPDSLICNIPVKWTENMQYVFQISTFLLFVIPMALISALYVQIGLALRRSQSARQGNVRISGLQLTSCSHSRKAVFKMLVAVVVAFCLCWAPFHAQRLMTIYVREDQWTATWLEIQTILFYISGVLYFVSCTVNPLLYNLMSRNYRQAFKITLCYRCLDDAARHQLRYGTSAGSMYFSERGPGAGGLHGTASSVGRGAGTRNGTFANGTRGVKHLTPTPSTTTTITAGHVSGQSDEGKSMTTASSMMAVFAPVGASHDGASHAVDGRCNSLRPPSTTAHYSSPCCDSVVTLHTRVSPAPSVLEPPPPYNPHRPVGSPPCSTTVR